MGRRWRVVVTSATGKRCGLEVDKDKGRMRRMLDFYRETWPSAAASIRLERCPDSATPKDGGDRG